VCRGIVRTPLATLVVGIGALLSISAAADEKPPPLRIQPLGSYEPNIIGYTHDSDDGWFMDFKVSVKYKLFPQLVRTCISPHLQTYFAFTGRFGQYFDRDSSPVVGKRFNPKLIFRYLPEVESPASSADVECGEREATPPESRLESVVEPREHFDFAYAHESNGQPINSAAEYQQTLSETEPESANDRISRGWDYLETTWKRDFLVLNDKRVSLYLTGKYFLQNGLLQGRPEEYNDWENDPEGKRRRSVDGLSVLIKLRAPVDLGQFSQTKFALLHETGYKDPFKYNTVRLEIGVKLAELPLTLWRQTGYNSDLAMYYKKVRSYGVQIEIGSF
jgi:hypothetical protein